jgi:hypothetical protein
VVVVLVVVVVSCSGNNTYEQHQFEPQQQANT